MQIPHVYAPFILDLLLKNLAAHIPMVCAQEISYQHLPDTHFHKFTKTEREVQALQRIVDIQKNELCIQRDYIAMLEENLEREQKKESGFIPLERPVPQKRKLEEEEPSLPPKGKKVGNKWQMLNNEQVPGTP